jgi:hypothetical protein
MAQSFAELARRACRWVGSVSSGKLIPATPCWLTYCLLGSLVSLGPIMTIPRRLHPLEGLSAGDGIGRSQQSSMHWAPPKPAGSRGFWSRVGWCSLALR